MRAVLACLLLAGCAASPPRFTLLDGGKVLEVNTRTETCQQGMDGCAVDVAGPVLSVCWTQSDGQTTTQTHEQEHCLGMRHGGWVYVNGRPCTVITDGGRTARVRGRMLCRNGDGTFEEKS